MRETAQRVIVGAPLTATVSGITPGADQQWHMVGPADIGNAEVETHLTQERRLRQRCALSFEIGCNIKNQPVGAYLECRIGKQRTARIAAVLVQREAQDQCGVVTLCSVQRAMHAGRGDALHGIEYVGAEAHSVFRETPRRIGESKKCIQFPRYGTASPPRFVFSIRRRMTHA